jgi:tetratricopeptide (TPR) repeat protein
LTKRIGTPNACSQCHTDQSLEWVLDAYEEWYGETRAPHYGTTFAAARANDPAAREPLKRLATTPEQPAIVRATALALLVQLWDGGPLPTLETAIESDVALLRRVAAEHLPLRSMADVERLAPLLSDPFRAVRLTTVARIATVPRELLNPAQQKAFEVALGEYRTAMAYTRDFASSNHNLGNLELALGDTEAAEGYYRAALEIDDLFYPAKSNLAVLLSEQGRYAEAEQLLREILDAYPDNADVMYSLGLLLVEMGRVADARAWLERAAARLPDHARLHYNLGLLRQQLGALDAAEAALRRALELQPENLDFLHALADHLLRRGRLSEAGAVADRIVTLFPDHPLGHRLRTMIEDAR